MHSVTLDSREPLQALQLAIDAAAPGSSVRLLFPPISINCSFDVDARTWPEPTLLCPDDRSKAIIPFPAWQSDTRDIKLTCFTPAFVVRVRREFVTSTLALTFHKSQG